MSRLPTPRPVKGISKAPLRPAASRVGRTVQEELVDRPSQGAATSNECPDPTRMAETSSLMLARRGPWAGYAAFLGLALYSWYRFCHRRALAASCAAGSCNGPSGSWGDERSQGQNMVS